MNIIFLGTPGVGKGTQTTKIIEKYKLVHISTGNIFRDNIRNKTKLGKKAKTYMNKGKLVPDNLTIQLVKDRLSKNDVKKGYILDGFPRTIYQADELSKFSNIDEVINFTADKPHILKRLSNRRICKKCHSNFNLLTIKPKSFGICDKCGAKLYPRHDDNPASIKKRLEIYKIHTKPLINYYKQKGLLRNIDANSENIDSISKNLIKTLDKIKQKLS